MKGMETTTKDCTRSSHDKLEYTAIDLKVVIETLLIENQLAR